ncbi:MAG TPA: hypothetical protein VFT56_10675 [Sphingomonas sp.]|nr:hypothetical protein [Sphingomonas sp.]
MNATTHMRDFDAQERRAVALTAGGSTLKTIGGVAVMALAILALIGVLPALLTAIAGIVFGAAMLAEGLSISSEYSALSRYIAYDSTEVAEFGGGLGVEVLVGLAAVALGVLSLLGVAAPTLLPALIIVGGVGLMLSAGTTQRLNDLQLAAVGHDDMARRVTRDAMTGAAAAQTLGGLAAMVLGILSLVSVSPLAAAGFGTLPQVGMLVLGTATALSGGALAGKATRIYRHS